MYIRILFDILYVKKKACFDVKNRYKNILVVFQMQLRTFVHFLMSMIRSTRLQLTGIQNICTMLGCDRGSMAFVEKVKYSQLIM